ncbi:GSCOCG00006311001-RA-CDS [Cotesia congregata]|uniref:Similar to PPP4R2r: Serine/threonine-protein phosphatase 4 regulatory subunit 2 (Drosophila melanogaster) n=1 Tax=Cotesia congregata TaxID=51543 RepID=A0A8J2HI41_COTCN|nr:GSCOCG00006311001-RA-CDS [Cotesia congregata]CAG5096401.1 Similar to PPP4R2r: Serine/threonine-protein phosphatase 4 regulatory subunit 2 (Drosophila melanogaster) [Cotesia congregata]
MDNPEEVLQALDEFSKMRPSEIPRELEDYLCFVAKTGDPVYQWSLIKPLFREKLVRVMTDFYENCPALDLASSPNLEHFNYDIMKCNLLELLESFANAPFTVQRICELLTSPRKEYNRVDKFMRAIEKNILVVSTKEPGPAARRSENGESILNGSIDDDDNITPNNQSSQEVEMESWVKDCTGDANSSSLTPTDHDQSLVDTISPSNKILTKDVNTNNPSTEDSSNLSIQDNNKDQSSRLEMTVSGFISAAHDLSSTPLITTPNSVHDTITTVNNLSNSTDQISSINDVSEAIINEDTSSQPSLDTENDNNSESNSNKKLQTTFESKDFAGKLNNELADKFYTGSNYKTEAESIIKNDDLSKSIDEKLHQNLKDDNSKSDDESKSCYESNLESETPEKRPRLDADIDEVKNNKIDNNRSFSVVSSQDETETNDSSRLIVSDTAIKSDKTDNLLGSDRNDQELQSAESCSHELQPEATFVAEQAPKLTSDDSKSNPEKSNEETTTEAQECQEDTPKPIIEEPPSESSSSSSFSSSMSSPSSSLNETTQESSKADDKQNSSVVIQEAMDDDNKLFSNASINDPIPIIEEPKDELTVPGTQLEISDYTKTDSDVPADSGTKDNPDNTEIQTQAESEELKVEDKNLVNLDGKNDAVAVAVAATVSAADDLNNMLPTIPDLSNTPMEKEESMESESMEVDNEEPNPVFEQDEPMEQESGDQIRS